VSNVTHKKIQEPSSSDIEIEWKMIGPTCVTSRAIEKVHPSATYSQIRELARIFG
jgi:hypothetical protein